MIKPIYPEVTYIPPPPDNEWGLILLLGVSIAMTLAALVMSIIALRRSLR